MSTRSLDSSSSSEDVGMEAPRGYYQYYKGINAKKQPISTPIAVPISPSKPLNSPLVPTSPYGLSQSDMHKIKALKSQCLHRLGNSIIQKYDTDIQLLEKSLQEENNKLMYIKKMLAKSSDVDGSNVVYRNTLRLNTTQQLPRDTEGKVKTYLKAHLTNFKPSNEKTRRLIEEIKRQNSATIQHFGKVGTEQANKLLNNHELIDVKQKERHNKILKDNFNFAVLPNLDPETKVFMNLDVQYDFVPVNEEYLRRMRLDFITKKEKIVDFVRKNLTASSHKQIFIKNSFQHDYQEWKRKIDSEFHEESHKYKVERYDIWNNKKKRKSIDDSGYEREAELFKNNRSDIPKANFNIYSREFFYIKTSLKQITNPVLYDYTYKNNDIWSIDDIRLFIIKYLSTPKDFETISSHFYNKTTRDIINFYFNFKTHFELRKHTEEVFGPNYIRKHISKKLEYISMVARKIINRITNTYIKEFDDYSKHKLHQPLRAYTTYQLLRIFSHLSACRKDHQVRKMEELYRDAKNNDHIETLKVFYDRENKYRGYSTYLDDIQSNGYRIEQKLLQNLGFLQNALRIRENELCAYVPLLNLKLNKITESTPQRKLCEVINLRKHDQKTQEIKMEEEEDFDHELELFRGRYQNSYLVVDKEFPQDVPPDDVSEIDDDSNFSPFPGHKYTEVNSHQDTEKAAQTYEMGIG